MGRKNHLGSKSRRGTEVAATLYTILETAKLHDIDPSRYVIAAVEAARRGEGPAVCHSLGPRGTTGRGED